MKLICDSSKETLKKIIQFRRKLYKGNINYKNNDETTIKEMVLGKTLFAKSSTIVPTVIEENSEIIGACIYIHNVNYNEYIQISFIEFEYDKREKILNLIINKAKEIGKEKGSKYIVIGLNGHVNYGLGLLDSGFDYKQSFGNSYNKEYYCSSIEKLGFKKTDLVSFKRSIEDFNFNRYEKILSRINKNFTYKCINKRNLEGDMEIYTSLNNEIFDEHKFYYKRDKQCDYELFKDLFYLIDENHLIYAYKDDEPIGFILWYPDFNELIPDGKYFNKFIFLRKVLNRKNIENFKVVEIGVVPKYQNSGVILGLFNECLKIAKKSHKTCESSWILKENFKSKNFGLKFDAEYYKEYAVYELEL